VVDPIDEFVRDGMVVVEGALDRGFCEAVVGGRLADIGVDEADRDTWPTGWHNLPATTVYPLDEVAPVAATVLHELVGGKDALVFDGLPDNLIVNFPDPDTPWWPPQEPETPGAGWHKDGDWFRHFLDSPEQGILGIVFWRDVTERQGATYVVADSIGPIARLLAEHPEGIDPGGFPAREIASRSQDVRPLTGRQGTIIWAHPFLVHSASVNATDRLRIISNTTAVLRRPTELSGDGPRTPVARVVLDALGVDQLDFTPTRERTRVVSERERRWKAERASQDSG
jgi:Phytanoyl-CoA dioxygenase (PhyH)